MDEHTLRVVKIDKEAIFELLYETFIAQEQELLDLSPVDVINDCAMDWEKGEFIFAAHLQENSLGEFNPLPKDIDIQELLKKIPVTTDSVLGQERIYRDFSFDQLKNSIIVVNKILIRRHNGYQRFYRKRTRDD